MPTMGRRRNDAASSVGWLEEWSSPRCKLWSAVRRRGAQSAADVGTFAPQRWERWRVDEIDGSRRSLELPLWPEDPAVVALETSLEMF